MFEKVWSAGGEFARRRWVSFLVWGLCVAVAVVVAYFALETRTPWRVASVASLVALGPYCLVTGCVFLYRLVRRQESWDKVAAAIGAAASLFLVPMAAGGFWLLSCFFSGVEGLASAKWVPLAFTYTMMWLFLIGDSLGATFTDTEAQGNYRRNILYLDLPFVFGLTAVVAVNAWSGAGADQLSAFTGGASALQMAVQNTSYALTTSVFDRS